MTRLRFAALAALVLAAGSTAASGFAFIDPVVRWAAGPVTMHFRLGGDSGTRIDGSTSWAEPVESALADWNPYFTGREFRAVRESTLPIALGDQVNSVFFFNQIFGRPFDSDTLAVTVGLTSGDWLVPGDVIVETDVIFNSTQRWNSYRGPLRQAMAGGTLYDIRRVALHEFGHVVGLDHPDAWGQTVASIMNSVLSNTEFLTADDIGGALSLYSGGSGGGGGGGGGVTVNFPPRNESQAFRNNLEAQYRDVLRRNPTASSVDLEGSVV